MRTSRGLEVALRVARIEVTQKLRVLVGVRAEIDRIAQRRETLVRNSEIAARSCVPAAGASCSAAELVQAHENRLASLRLRVAEDEHLEVARRAEAMALEALTSTQARARAYERALDRRRHEERRMRGRRAARRMDEQNLRTHEEDREERDHARSA